MLSFNRQLPTISSTRVTLRCSFHLYYTSASTLCTYCFIYLISRLVAPCEYALLPQKPPSLRNQCEGSLPYPQSRSITLPLFYFVIFIVHFILLYNTFFTMYSFLSISLYLKNRLLINKDFAYNFGSPHTTSGFSSIFVKGMR